VTVGSQNKLSKEQVQRLEAEQKALDDKAEVLRGAFTKSLMGNTQLGERNLNGVITGLGKNPDRDLSRFNLTKEQETSLRELAKLTKESNEIFIRIQD